MPKPDEYEAARPLISAPAGSVQYAQYGAVDVAAAAPNNGSAGAGSRSGDGDGTGSGSDTEFDAVAGIRLIEVVAQSWSKWGLIVAYMRLATLTPQNHSQCCR